MRVLRSVTLAFLLILCCPMIALAQDGDQSADNADQTQAPAAIILSITLSPPQQNTNIRQYNINSGDTAFVQLNSAGNPPDPNSPNQIQYQRQLGDVSNQIVQKISELNQKQQQLNQEIFPTQRPILQGQITVIQNELQTLQLRRTQLEAGQTATVANQITNPPAPGAGSVVQAKGINVKPEMVDDNTVAITVIAQNDDAHNSITQTTLGTWVRIYTPEGGGAQGVWAKVDLAK